MATQFAENQEELEEHLNNIKAFWTVLAGIQAGHGKSSDVNALTALRAALTLFFVNTDVRIVVETNH